MPTVVGQLDLPRGAAIVVVVGSIAVAGTVWIWILLHRHGR